jgi:hypothetical protein
MITVFVLLPDLDRVHVNQETMTSSTHDLTGRRSIIAYEYSIIAYEYSLWLI